MGATTERRQMSDKESSSNKHAIEKRVNIGEGFGWVDTQNGFSSAQKAMTWLRHNGEDGEAYRIVRVCSEHTASVETLQRVRLT